MKETVTRSCGHVEVVEVFGSAKERESKIKWYESTDCTMCTASSKNSDCDEIEMSYAEYKNNYSNCKTKPNSYNKSTKTITVYVTNEIEEIAEAKEITVEEIAEVAGATVESAKAMTEKSQKELEEKFTVLQAKLIKMNHPNKDDLVSRTRKAIDLIKKYKEQQAKGVKNV